jgi:NhaP-type Na+/H+ or K+/H+ antiporter
LPAWILAAATASSIGVALVALKAPGAEELLPVTFIIVAVTVAVYGIGAVLVARLLKLSGGDSGSARRGR